MLSTWGSDRVEINNARDWVRAQPASLSVFAAIRAPLIMVLDLSSTIGVLYYGLWSNMAGLILQVVINTVGFLKPTWVSAQK